MIKLVDIKKVAIGGVFINKEKLSIQDFKQLLEKDLRFILSIQNICQ